MSSLTLDGVTAHYVATGRGAPMILLHSGAGEARDWRRFVAALPPGYRCVALDLYGCGGTPAWPGPAALTIDDQVRLVAALARQLGHPVHLVGHSYGGAVALRVAVAQPDLVQTLSLVEPQSYPLLREAEDPLFDVSWSLWTRVRTAMEQGAVEDGWRRFVDYYSGDGFWDWLRVEVRASFVARSPIESWAALFSSPTNLGDLARLHVPTLVLCGERTTPPERRMCELVAGAIQGAALEFVPSAGHMSPITHPDQVAARVAAHGAAHPAVA